MKSAVSSIYVLLSNVEKDFATDYVQQTAKILSRDNCVIVAYYTAPLAISFLVQSPRTLLKVLFQWKKIITSKRNTIYDCQFISVLPFQRIKNIYQLNRKSTCVQLAILLYVRRMFLGVRQNIVLWLFHPTAYYFLKKLCENISLYDCVDYIEQRTEEKDNLLDLEQKLMQKADHIFVNSTRLAQTKKIEISKVHVVACGCAVDEFKMENLPKRPFGHLQNIKKPIIGYIGHLDYRLDYDLIEYILKRNPKISFVFIGKVLAKRSKEKNKTIPIEELKKYSNFHLLAAVKKNELKWYLQNFGMGIIPYDMDYGVVTYSNPMKFYEYMAMGIPVVSVPIPSLLNYKLLTIQFAEGYGQFHQKLHYLLDHPALKTKYKKQEHLIARQNSWEEKVNAILQKIY